jgi:hypothetical protein
MKKSKTPGWLVPAILVSGVVVLWSGLSKAATKPTPSNVQTAQVGNRLYSVTRLGQGNYLVTLVSTGGQFEASPVNYTFSQSGPLGEIGDPRKLAQLKADMNMMNLNFAG